MPYTLRATLEARLDVVETPAAADAPALGGDAPSLQYTAYSTRVSLNGEATSYPQIGNQAIDLSCTIPGGGSVDFDLTAAPWAGNIGQDVDLTGKKLVGLLLRAAITNNAAGITFGPQGANGYALLGAGVVPRLYPGGLLLLGVVDPTQTTTFTLSTPAVAAGAKDLRAAGASGDKLDVLAIFSE